MSQLEVVKAQSCSNDDLTGLQAAVVAVKRGQMSMKNASKHFSVPRSTIKAYIDLLNDSLDGSGQDFSHERTIQNIESITNDENLINDNNGQSSTCRQVVVDRVSAQIEKESKRSSLSKPKPAAQRKSEAAEEARTSNVPTEEDTHQFVFLPQSRVRTIMKSAPGVSFISQDALLAMTKAAEFFIAYLAQRAFQGRASPKSVHYSDLANFVQDDDELDFLHDMLPKKVRVADLPIFQRNGGGI